MPEQDRLSTANGDEMKFLCLGYFQPKKMDSRLESRLDSIMQECESHLQKLYKSGRVVVDAGVAPDLKRLNRVSGEVIMSQGPFEETQDMIGSAFIIEARD